MDASRRGVWLLAAGAAVGLALAAFGTFAPAQRSALAVGEVARVNGVPIERAELERALARVASDARDGVSDEARRRVLERLIDEELLVQRGAALGLVESDAAVRKVLAAAVISSAVAEAATVPPDEAELAAFYEANRGYFALPARVRVARVFVRDGDGADARVAAALAELGAGAEPAAVAARLGDATPLALPDAALPEAKLRELLGPAEAEAALALAPGARSEPLPTTGGRAILVSLERAPGASPELAAVREQVEAEWTRRAGERALAAYLERLRREAEIERAPATDAP